jgi:hypothetical protein
MSATLAFNLHEPGGDRGLAGERGRFEGRGLASQLARPPVSE